MRTLAFVEVLIVFALALAERSGELGGAEDPGRSADTQPAARAHRYVHRFDDVFRRFQRLVTWGVARQQGEVLVKHALQVVVVAVTKCALPIRRARTQTTCSDDGPRAGAAEEPGDRVSDAEGLFTGVMLR